MSDVPQYFDKQDLHTYLCVVNVVGVPDPIPQEFTYLVCVPEDGVLYFYSGHYTFDSADDTAMLIGGVVIKINLKGILDLGEDEESCQDNET